MTINYSIDENDFLTYQLYTASKSERIKKKRQRNKLMVPIFYILLGLYGYFTDRPIVMIIFWSIAVLWFCFYPLYERNRYRNYYKDLIKENYKGRLGQTGTLHFSEDFMLAIEDENESKISTKEIEQFIEISSAVFIKLKSGIFLILPKNKIPQFEQLKSYLMELAEGLNVDYAIEENWEWK